MKANIDVKDRREADAIRAGLADPAMRAMVIIIGTLNALPTARARHRVMEYVVDRLDEQGELPLPPPPPAAGNGGNGQ